MIHRKLHVIMWRYRNGKDHTIHSQGYDTKEIAMDKRKQLLEDREHVNQTDILYRCIVFKFDELARL